MAARSEFLPHDRGHWLLAIGQRLRAEYSAARDPIPERLAALVARLEALEVPAPGGDGQASPTAAERDPPAEREAASARSRPCPPLHEGSTAPPRFDLR
jgi:hypothetical protein